MNEDPAARAESSHSRRYSERPFYLGRPAQLEHVGA